MAKTAKTKRAAAPAWPGMLDTIQHGDCLELARAIPDKSVALAFMDPPFNIGDDYDQHDDKQDPATYLKWTAMWIDEAVRILKPDGSLWICASEEFICEIKVVAEGRFDLIAKGLQHEGDDAFIMREEKRLKQRHHMIWYYTFGVQCPRKLARSKTHMLHFVKSLKNHKWDEDAVRTASARQTDYNDKRANPAGRLPDDTWMIRPVDVVAAGGFREDHDVQLASRICGTFKNRAGTPNQMPEQLVGRVIRLCTDPGDVVVDFFAGSGTTPATAKKLGRRFVGFELSSEYALQATHRVEAAREGAMLDAPDVVAPRPRKVRKP